MRLRTLGGLEIDGIDFSSPKPLLLLAFLALEGPSDRRHLAELFWPGAAKPLGNLNTVLTRFRQAGEGLIEAGEAQVRTPLACDAREFLAALEADAPAEALERYRGKFLDSFYLKDWGAELEEWVYGTREVFADRARAALLNLAEGEASLGNFKAAAEHAEHAYLLSGAPEPRPEELVRLHRVLLASGSLEAGEVRKEGERYDLDLPTAVEEVRSELRGLAAERSAPHNLPVPATPFVGRGSELDWLGEQLVDPGVRLLTIAGAGGIGKTRLALEAARRSLPHFQDGAFFVPLVPVAAPELMIYAIANALGLRFFQQNDPQKQLLEFLQGKELLLVLDNLEHLLAGVELLPVLLAAAPNLKLLVTSRERLDLMAEKVFDLPGLGFPPVESDAVAGFDAVDLLVSSARNHRPDFALDPTTSADVARICRLVEGHPLALELAASWFRVLRPRDIVKEIGQGLDILQATARDLPARHRSLRAAFDHSWKLLEDQEVSVMRKLAVFRGGFRRDAAREVAGASLLLLAGLVDKSLLRVGADGRYDTHPLIHEFCQEKLAERPDLKGQVEELHGTYYIRFLGTQRSAMHDIAGVSWKDWTDLQREELGNIRGAWGWSITESRTLEFTWHNMWSFTFINSLKEGAAFFAQSISELDPGNPTHQVSLGHLLLNQAQILLWLTEIPSAHESVREGLELVRAHGDVGGVIRGLLVQGWAWWFSGENQDSMATFEEGLSLARDVDDALYIYCLVGKGAVFEAIEASAESRHYHQHALAEVRARGDAFNLGNYLLNLGGYLVNLGRLEEAEEHLQEALDHAREMGDALQQRNILHRLGRVAWRSDALDRTQQLFQEALRLAEGHGDRFVEAQALADLSRSLAAAGDLPEALRLVRRCLRLGQTIRTPRVPSAALVALADLRLTEGATEGATRWLRLVLTHPGTEEFYRHEARRLLEIHGAGPANDRAVTEDLEQVVAEILAELPVGG